MGTVRIIDRDKGVKRFERALYDLVSRRPTVTVGIHDDIGAEEHPGPSDASIVQVGVDQEFGGHSWLRSIVDSQRSRMEKAMSAAAQRALKSAIHGSSSYGHVDRAFGRVAVRFRKALQMRVLKLKLVDTGALYRSIEGRVRNRAPTSESM